MATEMKRPKSLHLLPEAKSQSWLEYENAFSTSSNCEACSGSLSFVSLLYVLTLSVHILNSQSLHYATYSCFLFGFQCLQHHTFQIIPFPLSVQIYIYFLTFRFVRTFSFPNNLLNNSNTEGDPQYRGSQQNITFPWPDIFWTKKVPEVYPHCDTS